MARGAVSSNMLRLTIYTTWNPLVVSQCRERQEGDSPKRANNINSHYQLQEFLEGNVDLYLALGQP